MTLLDVTSLAMTSAPQTLQSNILKHYNVNKTHCDVMPACVTSFSHINNEVYKSEFRNRTPESSPEVDFRFNSKFDFPKTKGASGVTNDDVTNETSSSDTSNRNNSNNNVVDAYSERTGSESGGSPADNRNQPPKKRKLFREVEHVTSAGEISSPSAFTPHLPKAANSSEILRQMYAAFGSTGAATEHLGLQPTRLQADSTESVRRKTERKRPSDESVTSRKSHSVLNSIPSSPHCVKKRKISHEENHHLHNHDASHVSHRRDTRERYPSGTESTNDSRGFRAYSRSDYMTQVKVSRDKDAQIKSPERNHKTSPPRRRNLSPEVKSSKRSRAESPKSPEPQANHPLMDYYRTNPYAGQYNPLMFHPSLAAFGLPSIPHIPHITHPSTLGSTPNPLLYGANPYFANPLLLREMLSQQSGLGATLHGGLTVPPLHMPQMLEQLQALQSMQLMAPGMLGAGLYPPNFQHLNNPYLLGVKDQLTSHPTRSNDAVKNPEASTEDSPKPRLPTPRFAKLPTPRTAIPRTALHSPQKSEPRKLPTDSYPVQIPFAADKNLHKKSPKDRTDRQTIKSSKQPISKQVKAEKKKMERKMADRPKQKHSNDVESTDIHPILKAHPNKQLRSQIQEARPRSPLAIPGLPVHGKPASYKNLTRERRLVANARERTRVHTISSAFEELRTQIPSYSCNQKLSKLAILRIACSYIRTLSVLSGRDETTTFGQGVDQCTRVLQAESRARSRRKTNKAQIEWEMTNYERHNQRDYHVTSTSGEDPLEISRDSSPQRTILDRLVESSSKSDDVTSDDDDVGQIDVTNMDVDVTNTSSDVLDDVTNKDHLTARKTKISENLNSNQTEPDVIL